MNDEVTIIDPPCSVCGAERPECVCGNIIRVEIPISDRYEPRTMFVGSSE